MISDSPAPEARSLNGRPADVTSLLHDSAIHPGWTHANSRRNRFYVVNLPQVLGKIPVKITKYQADFEAAEALIESQTTWRIHYPFEYSCSHTQIYDREVRLPKTFGRAVTIIVAMEIAATRTNAPVNVYDVLRILAADCFVDEFDEKRLQQLIEAHDAMGPSEKLAKFGPLAQKSFEDICLANIGQNKVRCH